MQLTEHRPGDHHVVRRITPDGIQIDEHQYAESLILGARLLDTDWPVTGWDDLDRETIEPLLTHQPELVLLGVGEQQSFPPIDVQRHFLCAGVGLECMTLDAAARTFNVLMSENRRALAGFILPAR
jgi:uncharacterized protein